MSKGLRLLIYGTLLFCSTSLASYLFYYTDHVLANVATLSLLIAVSVHIFKRVIPVFKKE
ncbi:hypothetical protein IMZ31_21455 (plasmid) [Pontibacillus sp. ALD_SL1]|uniref:hypothetical protein n=1 Tax=Pontibacillus sp. ALD_SL1 TaxID=2777185 RepID=UPI001A9599AF|nr:hypothetical protein [Pontibacillus sp. ALD_SL1]QST02020.1 hypothetical protein IMZ31_21455 [Pontibacillus sp. ALD_SL1]